VHQLRWDHSVHQTATVKTGNLFLPEVPEVASFLGPDQRTHTVYSKMDEMLRLTLVAFVGKVPPPKWFDLLLIVFFACLR
jgi:hypothetical protein